MLELGKYYTFAVYGTGYLGTNFTNVKIDCTLDYDSVRKLGLIDPITAHQAVYPSLPTGTPNNPRSYGYYKVTLPNGTETAVGVPWVDPTSVIELADLADYRFTVPNCTPAEVNAIRSQLASIGKTISNAEVIEH